MEKLTIKEFQDKLKDFTADNINTLEKGNTITLNIGGNDIDITYDMLDIRINSKDGFNASNEGNNFIILNTTLTEELINEGIVREFISKVQQIRKTNNLTQKQFADSINTTQSVISSYESGNTLIQTSFLYDICLKYDVSANDIIK